MKTSFVKASRRATICLALFAAVSVPGQQWEDLFVVNDGTVSVPPASSFGSGSCPIFMAIGTHMVGCNCAGLAPGAQNSNYADFGNDKGGNPTLSAGTTNVVIDGWYSGSDRNGNLAIFCNFHWYVATPVNTTTNVTICLTNTTSGYANLVWYFDGATAKQDSKVCPGFSDCMTETIRMNSDGGSQDSFSGTVNYAGSSTTNVAVMLQNPANSGVIMDFSWMFNGTYLYVDHNMMPGTADTKSQPCNLCNGDIFTGMAAQTGSAYTNVTGTVTNPFNDRTVTAYWILNGVTVKQEILGPGQTDSLTEQIPMGGQNTTFSWGYTVNGETTGGNGDNPFATNNIGLTYSNNPSGGFGGFGSTGGGGTTGPTGGGTGIGGTVGGSPPGGTNAPIWTGQIFTNNINYPTPLNGDTGNGTNGGSGGPWALDSTLRAVGGTLHNDNLETLKGLGIIDKDVQAVTQAILGKGTNIITVNVPPSSNVWVQNFPSLGPVTNLLTTIAGYDGNLNTEMGVLTNEAGQQVAYLAVLTNDVWQVVKAMTNQPSLADTNGYLGGVFTNTLNLNSVFGTFTNEAGQLVAYQGILSNDLWVITRELTNMAGSLTQQVIVNFPTNITVYAQAASNVFVMNWPSNLAAESTLAGISNLLAGAFMPTNGNLSLDTNFGAYLAITSDLGGYSVQFDGPTTYDAVMSVGTSAAQQSGLKTQETAFDTFVGNITDFSGNVLDTYPAVSMVIDFSAYGVPGGQMDLDPLHTDWGVELFAVAKSLFTWLIALSFLVKVTEEAWKAVMVIMGAHGINPQAVRTVVRNSGTSGPPGNPNV